MASWFQRIADAVYREYDRRIRRASLITDYGVHHHEARTGEENNRAEAEIINLPPGTVAAGAEDMSVEIVNLPRGTAVAAPEPAAPEATPAAGADE